MERAKWLKGKDVELEIVQQNIQRFSCLLQSSIVMLELLYEQIFFVHAALSLRQDSCCMRHWAARLCGAIYSTVRPARTQRKLGGSRVPKLVLLK